jgi:Response regulators consisting of a CheY-like receiver domain and a winged-helix DNA-binding domain
LLVLLSVEQQQELLQFFFENQSRITKGVICDVSETDSFQTSLKQTVTEIREGDLFFCLEQRSVSVCGQIIELTAKEFDALHLLIMNCKRVMTFEIISYQLWGEDYVGVSIKAIHNLMSRLRQKLQIKPDMPEYIVSIRGVGYKFEP